MIRHLRNLAASQHIGAIALLVFVVAIYAALVIAWAALPAQAQPASDWKLGTSTSDPACGGSISSGRRCYYPFTDATDSTVKEITAEYAEICLDPNIASTGAANAVVRIMRVTGDTPVGAPGDPNQAEPILDLSLTGSATANAHCLYEVPSGRFYVDVTSSAAGDSAIVMVQGSRVGR